MNSTTHSSSSQQKGLWTILWYPRVKDTICCHYVSCRIAAVSCTSESCARLLSSYCYHYYPRFKDTPLEFIQDSIISILLICSSLTRTSCLLQTFCTLIVNRFQSINPEKDGLTVRNIADLKNEVKIITLSDETFELWKEFLEQHSTGGLINPDMGAAFNQAKNFRMTKNFTLAREFFKHLGF